MVEVKFKAPQEGEAVIVNRVNEKQSFIANGNEIKKEEDKKEKSEILYDGVYYDIAKFIPKHPGGTIIKFYSETGEDATCAIQQFHKRSIDKVLGIMKSFKQRPATKTEVNLKNKKLNEDFHKFYKELEAEGTFDPDISHVSQRLLESFIFFSLTIYFSLFYTGMYGKLFAICFYTLTQMRNGWLMHEGGHNSLTGRPAIDKIIQMFTFSLTLGASPDLWNKNHSRHHAMPNRFHRDHDLNTLPGLAYNKIVVEKKTKVANSFFIQNQAILFFPITNLLLHLALVLYYHPKYSIEKRNWPVLALMLTHWIFVFNVLGLVPYLIASWINSNYYQLNFTLSHTHLPVSYEEELHWVEYAFVHSMDIEPSWWCDWWMGYLNYQIEHHLFPTMPQFRGPLIRERVKKFAEDHQLPYQCASYMTACKKMFNNLKKVSKEVKTLK